MQLALSVAFDQDELTNLNVLINRLHYDHKCLFVLSTNGFMVFNELNELPRMFRWMQEGHRQHVKNSLAALRISMDGQVSLWRNYDDLFGMTEMRKVREAIMLKIAKMQDMDIMHANLIERMMELTRERVQYHSTKVSGCHAKVCTVVVNGTEIDIPMFTPYSVQRMKRPHHWPKHEQMPLQKYINHHQLEGGIPRRLFQ